jgi:TonB family protein
VSRNQASEGVTTAGLPSDVLTESTDLESLLTAILGRPPEECDDKSELVAEVDARVAAVVHELGLESLLSERNERRRTAERIVQRIRESIHARSSSNVEPSPASLAAGDSAPLIARDPAPSVARDLVPSAAREPAPLVARDPVPSAARDPVPAAGRDGVPSVARDPVPSVPLVAQDPVPSAPFVAQDPVPSVALDPVPSIARVPVFFVAQDIVTSAPPADTQARSARTGQLIAMGVLASAVGFAAAAWLMVRSDNSDSASTSSAAANPGAPAPTEAVPARPAARVPVSNADAIPAPVTAAASAKAAATPAAPVAEPRRPAPTQTPVARSSPMGGAFPPPALPEPARTPRPESRISITPGPPAPQAATAPAATPGAAAVVPEIARSEPSVGQSSEPRRAAVAEPPPEAATVNPTPDAPASSAAAASAGPVAPSETSTLARGESAPNPTPGSPPSSGGSPVPQNQRRDPRVLSKVTARYPTELRSAGIGGDVVLRLTIDARGRIVKIQPISGPELLRREAITAVQRWRYAPATVSGVPVEAETTVLFTFDAQARREH